MAVKRTPYITSEYAATVLGKNVKFVLQLIRHGEIRAHKQTVKFNAKWIIDKASFEAFLTSLERGANG